MIHIPCTHMHQDQISVRNPTRIQNNNGVLICDIGAKKPVWHNEEIKTPPHNSQGRCIGCI